jgi:hypothetical protein
MVRLQGQLRRGRDNYGHSAMYTTFYVLKLRTLGGMSSLERCLFMCIHRLPVFRGL